MDFDLNAFCYDAAQSAQTEADACYCLPGDLLDTARAHQVCQKIVYRLEAFDLALDCAQADQPSPMLSLARKISDGAKTDIDYAYPDNGAFSEDCAHPALLCAKARCQSLEAAASCIGPAPCEFDPARFAADLMDSFEADTDYAYPGGSYDDDCAFVCIEALASKTDALLEAFRCCKPGCDADQAWLDDACARREQICRVLDGAYDSQGYYIKDSAHEAISEVLNLAREFSRSARAASGAPGPIAGKRLPALRG